MSTTAQKPATTPIPVQLSEPEFAAFILPYLSMPKRGPKCKLGYYRVFNLILWVLDGGFDSTRNRKCIFNAGMIPNIKENPRNRQGTKRGRKRLFNAVIHALRLRVERTFAWEDKFSATRQDWSKGIGGGDAFMKLCSSSSGCKTRPAKGEPA